MGFLDKLNKKHYDQRVQKEIEIDYEGEEQKLVNTFNEAGLKASVRGDKITVGLKQGFGGLFKSLKGVTVTGNIIRVEGNWSGSVIIEGNQAEVTEMYAKFKAYFKAFCK